MPVNFAVDRSAAATAVGTWAYLAADSKLIHATWEALTKDEQQLVARQIIAAVGQQEGG